MNIKEARKKLTPLGVEIKKNEYGEYRVNFKGGREATAYYTDDLQDAVWTGITMAKKKGLTNPGWIKASAVRVIKDSKGRPKAIQIRKVGGGRVSNPFEPGLNKTWYRKGQAAGNSGKYKEMYSAWSRQKGKPKTPGAKVGAQESFYQGFMDVRYKSYD